MPQTLLSLSPGRWNASRWNEKWRSRLLLCTHSWILLNFLLRKGRLTLAEKMLQQSKILVRLYQWSVSGFKETYLINNLRFLNWHWSSHKRKCWSILFGICIYLQFWPQLNWITSTVNSVNTLAVWLLSATPCAFFIRLVQLFKPQYTCHSVLVTWFMKISQQTWIKAPRPLKRQDIDSSLHRDDGQIWDQAYIRKHGLLVSYSLHKAHRQTAILPGKMTACTVFWASLWHSIVESVVVSVYV